ncbi:MAG: hypothetical protein IJ157_11505 [Clostridia bacterium]|nr:hypothetical protein [Clostridia bacterium]
MAAMLTGHGEIMIDASHTFNELSPGVENTHFDLDYFYADGRKSLTGNPLPGTAFTHT